MKQHYFFSLCMLAACGTAMAAVPTFVPRSQSVNAAREIVGWQQLINLWDADEDYSVFTATAEYTKSFRAKELAQCLFGSDVVLENCSGLAGINVSGSLVVGRGEHDWLADYFGLPTDFQSTIFLQPEIKNFLVDLNYYQGLDSLLCGLYFRIHAPLVHTRWSLDTQENVVTAGINDYAPGYFNGAPIFRENLLNNALDFLSGNKSASMVGNLSFSQCTQTILNQKLQNSKLPTDGCHCKALTKTYLSDIELTLGWNFVRCENYLLGLSLRASAPTGTTVCSDYFFAPIIGDGHHWKVGAGLNGQVTLWNSDCNEKTLGLFLDARVQHLFKAKQTRTFDLCGKPNSRYMLAQKLGTTRLPVHIVGIADSSYEFQNEFAPVANLTKACVDVDVAVEGDIAIKLAYMTPCWEFDIGYEFWARSCEKICRNICVPSLLADKTWALKGDAYVIGFDLKEMQGQPEVICQRLSATESQATINKGTNNHTGPLEEDGGINGIPANANPRIDNPIALTAENAGILVSTLIAGDIPTRSSNPPIFLSDADLDLSGTKGLSNKIFAHLSRTWECECYTPFLGLGGEIECAPQNCSQKCSTASNSTTSNCSTSSCTSNNNNCQRCSLSQWGIWVKGGIAFN